jgi:hypothetical protein
VRDVPDATQVDVTLAPITGPTPTSARRQAVIDQETLRKLREMKLDGMAAGFEELLARSPARHDADRARRHPRRPRVVGPREPQADRVCSRLAKIGHDACLEDVRCEPGRGLDKAVSATSPPAAGSSPSST